MTTINDDNLSTKDVDKDKLNTSTKKDKSSTKLKMNFTFKLPPKDSNSDDDKQKNIDSVENNSGLIEKKTIIFDTDTKPANSPKKILLASKNSNKNINTKVSGKFLGNANLNSNSTILLFSPNPLHNKYDKMLAQIGSDIDLRSKIILLNYI